MAYSVVKLLLICCTFLATNGQHLNILQQVGQNIINLVKNNLDDQQLQDIYAQISLFGKIERDILLARETGSKPSISPECLTSLKEFYKGLTEKRIWALQMVDSFGKLPNGILGATLMSLGDYDLCVETVLPDKFQGRHCTLLIKSAGQSGLLPPQMPHIFHKPDITKTFDEFMPVSGNKSSIFISTSVCLPSSCSTEEVPHILAKVNNPKTSGLKIEVEQCLVKSKLNYTNGDLIIAGLLLVLLLFEVGATILDIRVRSLYPDEDQRLKLSAATKQILCFSLYTNTIRLFKKDDNPDSIKIFHGLKFLSMGWIILGHTLLFHMKIIGRYRYAIQHITSGFFFQIVMNPFPGLETFFFIGGFLVMYSYMKINMPYINIGLFALYRYLRLIPPVFSVIAVSLLSANLLEGPLWNMFIIDYIVGTCKSTWWKNLLLINNVSGSCLIWTWYIAIDMQLYMAAYFLLLVFRRNTRRALNILKLLIVLDVVLIGVTHFVYELPPIATLNYISPFYYIYIVEIMHSRAINHLIPYCFGISVAYRISTGKTFNLTKMQKFYGWTISFLLSFISVFSSYIWNGGHIATLLESVLYGSFSRLMWSISLSWITYCCLNGYGGFVTSILSWQGFVPLSRVTFMAFLLHPLCMHIVLGQTRQVYAADRMLLIITFFGYLVISYAFAFIFTVLFESPFMGILNVTIRSKTGKMKSMDKKENFTV